MRITLSGVETNNKGAELMFYAILQEIERKYPEAEVYVGVGKVKQGLSYLKTRLLLKEKPIAKFCIRGTVRLNLLLQRLHLDRFLIDDIYAVKGTNYFIDASGFFFSDQWNITTEQINKWENLLRRNAKEGAKIIFLPQAFGPVSKPNTIKILKVLNDYADIIMPREKTSLDYLKQSRVINMEKVSLFPDFTPMVKGSIPSQYKHLENAVCIIPNIRMIDHGNISLDNYIHLIGEIIKLARQNGRNVYLLNHEGKGDERLAYMISNNLNNQVEVVTGINGLEVKGLISTAYLVISSRFHGVASALSSTVPCLATSWSHKYDELFNEYEQKDSILNLKSLEDCLHKVNIFLHEDFNSQVRNKLCEVLPTMLDKNKNMWKLIWEI